VLLEEGRRSCRSRGRVLAKGEEKRSSREKLHSKRFFIWTLLLREKRGAGVEEGNEGEKRGALSESEGKGKGAVPTPETGKVRGYWKEETLDFLSKEREEREKVQSKLLKRVFHLWVRTLLPASSRNISLEGAIPAAKKRRGGLNPKKGKGKGGEGLHRMTPSLISKRSHVLFSSI